MTIIFEFTFGEQSNAFYRAFLSLLVFEQGRVFLLPPPPIIANVAETAIRERVKNLVISRICYSID